MRTVAVPVACLHYDDHVPFREDEDARSARIDALEAENRRYDYSIKRIRFLEGFLAAHKRDAEKSDRTF